MTCEFDPPNLTIPAGDPLLASHEKRRGRQRWDKTVFAKDPSWPTLLLPFLLLGHEARGQETGPNLLRNNDFGDVAAAEPIGWTKSGSGTWSIEPGRFGDFRMKVADRTSPNRQVFLRITGDGLASTGLTSGRTINGTDFAAPNQYQELAVEFIARLSAESSTWSTGPGARTCGSTV